MTQSKKLIINTLLLTASSLVMRSVGMAFQVYLSGKIGAAGIGLIGLIMSVNVLAATLAISGMRFSATRLVSEELGMGNPSDAVKAMRRCLTFALLFGFLAAAGLYFGAPFIGTRLIGDGRTVLALKILAGSMPFLSAGAVISGYFTAVNQVGKAALGQLCEQAGGIAVTILIFSSGMVDSVESACAAFAAGCAAGEVLSLLLLIVLYFVGRQSVKTKKTGKGHITRRMFGIAIPLALSAYARTALTTLQNLLVPRGLKKSGATAERALADYGTIQGMVFPVITFPAAFFASLSELLVPELTKAQVSGKIERIEIIANKILHMCLIFSIGVMGLLFFYAEDLGQTIYGDKTIGRYIMLFSALMPIAYMDSVTDGMLRGLGQHLYSMKYNVIDSSISVLLIWLLLPRYGVAAYVFVLYFSEIFNFSLSIGRLRKVTKISLQLTEILRGMFAVFSAVNITEAVLRLAHFPLVWKPIYLSVHIAASSVLYAVIVYLTGEKENRLGQYLRDLLVFDKRRKDAVSGRQTAREKHRCL